MQICGINQTTLLDYPEHLAATIFVGGCNFRCPFCHNSSLVLPDGSRSYINEEETFSFLEKRRGILEGVCITGGEPTLAFGLREFIIKIKKMGYLVKLDTNGYCPEVLGELLEYDLLDYVAMDIKSSPENYEKAAGVSDIDISLVNKSIFRLKAGNIPYEFRTTVVKGLHQKEDFEGIGKWIAGCREYILQSFEDSGSTISGSAYFSFSKSEMQEFAYIARKYIDNVKLRGVE